MIKISETICRNIFSYNLYVSLLLPNFLLTYSLLCFVLLDIPLFCSTSDDGRDYNVVFLSFWTIQDSIQVWVSLYECCWVIVICGSLVVIWWCCDNSIVIELIKSLQRFWNSRYTWTNWSMIVNCFCLCFLS